MGSQVSPGPWPPEGAPKSAYLVHTRASCTQYTGPQSCLCTQYTESSLAEWAHKLSPMGALGGCRDLPPGAEREGRDYLHIYIL